MGRGGGHSGGGHHGSSGGHFHYSSGGRSGRSSSHSSYSGGSSYHSHPHHYHSYGPVVYGGYWNPGSFIAAVVVFVVALAILFATHGGSIQKSTHERTKLDSEYCKVIDTWYVDDIDWIHDERTLVNGLKKFYDETGVQPLLYITDNINGKARPSSSDFENKLQEMYDQYFTDDGHVIVCFMESSSSDYATYYYAGAKAKNVIDDEGGEILLDYLDYHYTDSMEDEEYFATSFKEAANRMMSVQKTTKQLVITLVTVLVAVVAIVAIAVISLKKRREARLQAEADAKILNTKIEEED